MRTDPVNVQRSREKGRYSLRQTARINKGTISALLLRVRQNPIKQVARIKITIVPPGLTCQPSRSGLWSLTDTSKAAQAEMPARYKTKMAIPLFT